MLGKSPFNSPRLLIADARDDIQRFNTTVENYLKYTPHPASSYQDFEKTRFVHTMKFRDPLPDNLPVLVRKVVGSLRSSLDQAVYASVIILKSGNPNSAKFPFSDTEDGLAVELKRKCRGVAPGITKLLAEFKPYRGGNDTLWALNKLRNIKEHRLLAPANLAGGVAFEVEGFPKIRAYMFERQGGDNRWNPDTNELTSETLGPLNFLNKYKTVLFIRFGDIEVVGGKDVVPLLRDFTRIAESYVGAIETETQRLFCERS